MVQINPMYPSISLMGDTLTVNRFLFVDVPKAHEQLVNEAALMVTRQCEHSLGEPMMGDVVLRDNN